MVAEVMPQRSRAVMSSIFHASSVFGTLLAAATGAYIVAIPYIAKEVYGGDAAFFATVMTIFTVGSIGSNLILLLFMPLRHPGRLFLMMQLTRAAILLLSHALVLFWVNDTVGAYRKEILGFAAFVPLLLPASGGRTAAALLIFALAATISQLPLLNSRSNTVRRCST